MRRPTRIRLRLPLPLALLALALACSSTPTPTDDPAPLVAPVPRLVEASGRLVLGQSRPAAATVADLRTRVGNLLRHDRGGSAAELVRAMPDVALELLRGADTAAAGDAAVQFIAQVYDESAVSTGAVGYHELVADRRAAPERYVRFDTQRKELLAHMHGGRFARAGGTDLAAVDGPAAMLLSIEAARLTGVARLLADDPAAAATAFGGALAMTGGRYPHQATHLKLLLSDAQRRAGLADAANATWLTAASDLANRLSAQPLLKDVTLVQRLIALRPAGADWPAALGGPDRARGNLYEHIGEWSLQRGEPEAALSAFSQAGQIGVDPATEMRSRLGQARALAALHQSGAAAAILASLATGDDPAIRSPALAMLGVLALDRGNTQHAHSLLRRAVEDSPTVDWLGRARAEADLGLACLMVGDEPDGLRWLESAARRFAAAGETRQLSRCLQNRLRYHEHSGNDSAARTIRTQLASVEGRSTYPTGG